MNLLEIIVVGGLATVASDVWQQLQKPFTGIPGANWPVTGRWVLGCGKGKFYAPKIASHPPLKGEAVVGWTFHYAIGIAYAAIYLGILYAVDIKPNIINGLFFGILTLAAPFLLMKPALGGGLFGLKAPNPGKGLFLSVTAHAAFGMGLYIGIIFYNFLRSAI
ncbi:DUF2938 family protein [Brucellaceae bacterium C25G]